YFGKDAQDLTVSEAAMLAGLVQRPSSYDPRRNFTAADNRRRYVLGRMLGDGHITQEIYDREIDVPPVIQHHPDLENLAVAGHFTEEVRRLLFERLEGDEVLNGGLRIETTLDIELQRAASVAVQDGLRAHDRRRGYRGPVRQVDLEVEGALAAELETLAEENADEYLETEILSESE
ncbi:MAG: transglycosylase domain-containing protein, partial [Actinomycetota bacterium]